MNILILNWRDSKNPQSGGAEVLTHEMAKRWAAWGHTVVQLSASFPGARREEVIDGVTVVRHGAWWSVHIWAFILWMVRFGAWADVVIDEAHWFPFFSILYAPKKTVLLVCEVATSLFDKLFPKPLSLLGQALERVYFVLYRRTPTLAISPSTKEALIAAGFAKERVAVLPMGLTVPVKDSQIKRKETIPTIAYLGRLHTLKGAHDAVKAFSFIKRNIPRSQFWIIGDGDSAYKQKIKQQIKDLGLTDSTRFFGFVDEKQKFELLSRAYILLAPSTHEGWGLTVVEAAYQGTPTITYNVGGLCDSVQHDKTGVVVSNNTPQALAHEALSLLSDAKRYARYQNFGKLWSRGLSWDFTAKVALSAIEKM